MALAFFSLGLENCGGQLEGDTADAPGNGEIAPSIGLRPGEDGSGTARARQSRLEVTDDPGNMAARDPAPTAVAVDSESGRRAETSGVEASNERKPGPALEARPGTIAGTVRDATGRAVGGGTIDLIDEAGNIVSSVAPDRMGRYRIGKLATGTYTLHLDPPPGSSIGAGQTTDLTVDVGGGDTTHAPLTVTGAIWFDDFTSYTSEEDFTERFANDPGGFRIGASGLARACNEDRIVWDPEGGPGGKPAMRYDYWNRVQDPTGVDHNPAPCGRENPEASYSLYYARVFEPPRPEGDEMWIRFVSKEGTNPTEDPGGPNWFTITCAPRCAELGGDYKFFRTAFRNESGQMMDGIFSIRMGSSGRDGDPFSGHFLQWIRFLPFPGASPGFGPRPSRTQRDRRTRPARPPRPGTPGAVRRRSTKRKTTVEMGNAADWQGRWHTYVYGYEAVDGDWNNVKLQVWLDGELVINLRGISRKPAGELEVLLIGANMNAGPSQTQSRWFSEVGVYATRPSVRPAR